MKSTKSILLLLLLVMVLALGSALPQSATATVAGRVGGLPNENVASLQVALPAITRHALFCKPIRQPMDRFASRSFAPETIALP